MMITKVTLADKFDLIQAVYQPKIAGELNDAYLKLVKIQGEFVWHQHATEDELFWVVQGRLLLKLRDGELWLEPGEFAIIPRGVEHCPYAEVETQVILLEPKSTLNTGDTQNDRTITQLEWI
jgi:mannose-6-phosphate isomerase-like protein (cupin superfamily)